MNGAVTVGLLHPGRMGAAIAAQIVEGGHTVLWCPDGRSQATHHRAVDAGLRPVPLGQLLADSEIVMSICPPAVAEPIATEVADNGYRGVYVDANAVSPARTQRMATRLTTAGAVALDACIFGAPPGRQPSARLYLTGDPVASRLVAGLFKDSLVEPFILGEHPGQASALKMAFASYQRASRTAAAIAHALADDHGITEALLVEAERMPRDILVDRDYVPSVAARAWRWAPEMHEVADTLSERHLPTDIAVATATILRHWAASATDEPADPATILRQLHTRPS